MTRLTFPEPAADLLGPSHDDRGRQRSEVDTPHDRQARRRTPRLGIHVCPQIVARLLKAMGYSLRVNHKKLAGASNPNRDRQFRHITDLRDRCAADNSPHQRRHQEEEGARRHVPQSRRQVGPQPRTRQRPRLPLRRRRPRRALRHLRPPRECRHRLRRQNRRHPGVRRRLHREGGGGPRATSAIPEPRPCRSWPTAAAATAARRAPGRSICNIASATGTACR